MDLCGQRRFFCKLPDPKILRLSDVHHLDGFDSVVSYDARKRTPFPTFLDIGQSQKNMLGPSTCLRKITECRWSVINDAELGAATPVSKQ
jgi:hypothetical protein